MGTHSVLGVKHADGEIVGCYVHFDGYPSHMLSAINDYVKNFSTSELSGLIEKAQESGGMRCFHSPSAVYRGDRKTELLNDNMPYKIDKYNFYEDHGGTYAWYLVDAKTGRPFMWTKTYCD